METQFYPKRRIAEHDRLVQEVLEIRVLVTGGAGFIGRWVTKRLLEKKCRVSVLDDLSYAKMENLEEFEKNPFLEEIAVGDIRNKDVVSNLFRHKIDTCVHMAALVSVQRSINNPRETFDVNVNGTFNILEAARKSKTKVVFVSSCLVYDTTSVRKAITEEHPTKALSPYAASKIAGEGISKSFYFAYGLPIVVLRPFNTYGPFQRADNEGGVVTIFIKRKLEGKSIFVYGDGTQTRDLLYVEDCADFIVKASLSNEVNGETLNAGLGKDISINNLASLILSDDKRIEHVIHHHPKCEIQKLICNYNKAKNLLGWEPKITLREGINRTEKWLKETME